MEIYVQPSLFHVPDDEPQSFWCRHCDMNMVDSTDPSSGLFLYHIGHVWKGYLNNKPGEKKMSDHTSMIVFALCYPCIRIFSFEIEDTILSGKTVSLPEAK